MVSQGQLAPAGQTFAGCNNAQELPFLQRTDSPLCEHLRSTQGAFIPTSPCLAGHADGLGTDS